MTDRWAQAEERFRQREADRRYRRDDSAWGAQESDGRHGRHSQAPAAHQPDDEWGEFADETTVIPRYGDEPDFIDGGFLDDDYPDQVYPDQAYPGEQYQDEDYLHDDAPVIAPPPPPRRRAQRPPPERAERPQRGTRRAAPERARSTRGRRSRTAARKAAERKRRRRNLWLLAIVAVLVVGGVVVYGAMKLVDSFSGPEDFAGPAGPIVVVQVEPGDTSQQIASTMVERGVVASTGAFVQAAVRNSNMNSVQPGYYGIPSNSPAAEAVTALIAPMSRVGNLVISEGRQLHDQRDVTTGARKEGIYRKIADASCVGDAAAKKCVTYEELDQAGASADLDALGVPTWAQDAVRKVPDHARQLEGLIAAGTWDFDPSGTPLGILKQLVSTSAAQYESTGLQPTGAQTKLSPYEALIAASLVEREALPQDMSKVARVIMNRLDIDQPLQFDSSVNYALDRTEVATTDVDREAVTPWNTYASPGLPATPIASPSLNALRAIENPEPGPWLYFVTVDKDGTTLFTDGYQEHLNNIEKARQSGILDSGR
ncbi:endolytic transglycosylase MltG [Nocardia callitridis]|uniref:Endolytic murein transglycosylase n=1 Tax=Nocardia callitridis TaxID=648753 RepID=A0ABP9KCB8_9NOCA